MKRVAITLLALAAASAHAATIVVVPARAPVVIVPRPVMIPSRPAPAPARSVPAAEPARPLPAVVPAVPARPACTDERRARKECS